MPATIRLVTVKDASEKDEVKAPKVPATMHIDLECPFLFVAWSSIASIHCSFRLPVHNLKLADHGAVEHTMPSAGCGAFVKRP